MCIEDIAADRLSQSLPVIWQCEVDLRWRVWTDYSELHTSMLEAAWEAMRPEVELDAWDGAGGYDVWLVSLVSMLQTNQHTGTLRRVRRVLVTHR